MYKKNTKWIKPQILVWKKLNSLTNHYTLLRVKSIIKISNLNVWYSDHIAINLLSGSKLAESEIICKINKENYKPKLEIKNNGELIFKTYGNKQNYFKIKTLNKLWSNINKINKINCVNENFSIKFKTI